MDGKPIKRRFHRVWDGHVRTHAGGLSILRPIMGQWVEPAADELLEERMIPVRISCTKEQLTVILRFTKQYYKQDVVMAYKVSDEVIFYHGD